MLTCKLCGLSNGTAIFLRGGKADLPPLWRTAVLPQSCCAPWCTAATPAPVCAGFQLLEHEFQEEYRIQTARAPCFPETFFPESSKTAHYLWDKIQVHFKGWPLIHFFNLIAHIPLLIPIPFTKISLFFCVFFSFLPFLDSAIPFQPIYFCKYRGRNEL